MAHFCSTNNIWRTHVSPGKNNCTQNIDFKQMHVLTRDKLHYTVEKKKEALKSINY